MDQNKFDDAKNLLEKEIDELDNPDKKERMKFFLNEYSKPKFNINASLLVFLVTLILCLLWQNNEQRVFIDKQQQEVNSLILYMIYTCPELFPNDSIFPESDQPFDFELSEDNLPAKLI